MSKADSRVRRTGTWTAMSLLLTGTAFQIPSCSTLARVFNPCGTVFAFCNARDVDALFGDIPDYSLDPSCTIPFFGIDNDGGGGTTGGGGGIGGGGGQVGNCATQEIFPTTPGPRP
ncbi:MAG: hypothetical protein DHS20C16_15210 [Phycisphaerae bacterium]|nr:MAG: hypothetical protein DHS20C16_15210 [Phycisphaerae bacterium]